MGTTPTGWLWDQHTCLPLDINADVNQLDRYLRPALGGFVSVNVGYSPHSRAESLGLLTAFRSRVDEHPRLQLVDTVTAIDEAAAAGNVVVAFDLEDCAPLEGDVGVVHRFAELRVRTMLPSYNHANIAGSASPTTRPGPAPLPAGSSGSPASGSSSDRTPPLWTR